MATSNNSVITSKWGRSSEDGFLQIPDILIHAQNEIGLTTLDLAIILNLVSHWWTKENLPHPRPSVIAKRIGVSTRTVERRIAKLTEDGLIRRLPSEKGDGVAKRRFDLSGLVNRLNELAHVQSNRRNRRLILPVGAGAEAHG